MDKKKVIGDVVITAFATIGVFTTAIVASGVKKIHRKSKEEAKQKRKTRERKLKEERDFIKRRKGSIDREWEIQKDLLKKINERIEDEDRKLTIKMAGIEMDKIVKEENDEMINTLYSLYNESEKRAKEDVSETVNRVFKKEEE